MNRLFILCLLFYAPFSWAQSSLEESEIEVRELYQEFESSPEASTKNKINIEKQKSIKSLINPKKLSELAKLTLFSDVAVIQKRYLPKTDRFELSGFLASGLNNPFFNNFGGALNLSYYFSEAWGLEASYILFSGSERKVTENLKNKRSIQTTNLVKPKNYYGLAIKWAPIYGKMAWLNNTIVPFDIYFAPGLGTTNTELGKSELTYHIGLGQNFALSKAFSIRWDISWSFYNATVIQDEIEVQQLSNDLVLLVGASFFFPEAKYR